MNGALSGLASSLPEFAAVRARYEEAVRNVPAEMKAQVNLASTIDPCWERMKDITETACRTPSSVAVLKASLAALFKEQVWRVCDEMCRTSNTGLNRTGALDRIDSIRSWWHRNGIGSRPRKIRDDIAYADKLIEVSRRVASVKEAQH